MSDKLNELEKELEKILSKSYGSYENIEAAFNLGMKVAYELTNLKITDYKIKCLENKRSEEDRKDKFNESINKIEKLLLMIVRASVKEHINDMGSWTVEKNDRRGNADKFNDEIVNNFNVQYIGAGMTSYGGDFELDFEIVGELKSLLQRYDIYSNMNANLSNENGEEYDSLDSEDEVRRIRFLSLSTLQRLHNKTIEESEEIHAEISKLYMFKLLANKVN